ncbi:hypothetical protein IEO21_09757 [Rhodonia placenta]|uniref:Uncharacterized protein n=1 Tax=Rhodonia placenta TaxID=104341 RepID=A0A8H7TY45_9APHY|nr:hypothetical protein IEO21_09757 [Postia placenta]
MWKLHSICNSLEEWCQLSNWTDFDNRAVRPSNGSEHSAQLVMLAEADAIVTDVSFLEKVVRPCIQQQKAENIKDTLSAYYNIMEHRAHHINRSLSPPGLAWDCNEQDSETIVTLGHLSVDVLLQISEKSPLDDAGKRAQSDHVYCILEQLLEAAPWAKRATYTRLMSSWRIPELLQEHLGILVELIWLDVPEAQRDIEDTRKLLTFVLHAREQPSTWQFLRIISSALQHSAQLPSHDFDSVRCDIRGVLDIIGEYFSSSGIEDVVRGHACTNMTFISNTTQPVAEATVGFAPMPQDGIDEAPREHSRAVEETPVV